MQVFRPLIPKFAQTLGLALRLTPYGIPESGSKQGAIYNETVFACASCGHSACCGRNESSQSGPNEESRSESGAFSIRGDVGQVERYWEQTRRDGEGFSRRQIRLQGAEGPAHLRPESSARRRTGFRSDTQGFRIKRRA